MKIDILNRKKNPLLSREEITFELLDFKETPNREEIRNKIAAQTNSKDDLIIVSSVVQQFGTKKIQGNAKIYSSAEEMAKIEPEYAIKRNSGKKADAAKPEQKEEKEKAEAQGDGK